MTAAPSTPAKSGQDPAVERKLLAGEILFYEGQVPTSLFIIRKGTVSIRKRNKEEFVEIAQVHDGEVIGELSFFDRLPRSADAVALTEISVLEIRFEGLEKIYESIPSYLKTIMTSMATRLRQANDVIKDLRQNKLTLL